MKIRKLDRRQKSIALRLTGSALIATGLLRRNRWGTLLAAGGGYLVLRSLRDAGHEKGLRNLWQQGLTLRRTLTIDAPREYVYQFWKDFSRFPEFMQHVRAVEPVESGLWRWKVQGPLGLEFTWQARVLANEENQRIAWESVDGSEIENHGLIEFRDATGGRGTLLSVEIFYRPPAGKVGAGFASLFGENPEQQMREDLRRVKQLIEAGEVPTTAGQPSGRRSKVLKAIKTLHGEGRERARSTIRSAS